MSATGASRCTLMSFEGKQNTTVHIERYQIDPGVKGDIYKRNSASASGLERRHDPEGFQHTAAATPNDVEVFTVIVYYDRPECD